MTDRLDDLLRQAGHSYAGSHPVQGPRPDDVDRRSRARRRNHRVLAGGLAALALLAGAAALARPAERASQGVDYGNVNQAPTTGSDPAVTVAPPASTTTTSPPTTTAVTTTSSSLPSRAPDVTGIRDYTWRSHLYGPAQCPNWPDDPTPITVAPEGVNPPAPGVRWVRLVSVAYGDLTGDRTDEAVVVLECGGGAHAPLYGWIYRESVASDVALLGPVEVGPAVEQDLRTRYGIDAFVPRSFTVRDGRVIVEGSGLRPDDPFCCPGYPRVVLSLEADGRGTVVTVEPLPGQGPGA